MIQTIPLIEARAHLSDLVDRTFVAGYSAGWPGCTRPAS